VQRVLNDQPGIGDETRKFIKEKAKEMGYVPNIFGSALNSKKAEIIGVVLPVSATPVFHLVEEGINAAAFSHGLKTAVMYSNDNPEDERAILRLFRQIRICGLLIAPVPSTENIPLLEKLSKEIPVVQIERKLPDLSSHYVGSENEAGAFAATTHLLERGHKRIGFVTPVDTFSTQQERQKGYEQALEAHGVKPDPSWIFRTDFTKFTAIVDFIGNYSKDQDLPRALVWSRDKVELLAGQLRKQYRWKIGRELDVMALDPESRMEHDMIGQMVPGYQQHGYAMGNLAAQIVINSLEDNSAPEQDIEQRVPYQKAYRAGNTVMETLEQPPVLDAPVPKIRKSN
jgi:LacI family transcriptional regulator